MTPDFTFPIFGRKRQDARGHEPRRPRDEKEIPTVQRKHLRPRITTSIVAFVVAASSAVFVAAPSASADGLSNPSGTLTVSCPGADAFIQVDWKGANAVTIRWRVDDTGTAANFSPVLRIQAHDSDHTAAPFVFPGDNAYYILKSGNGTHEVGLKSDWNPSNLADINHLKVRVQNGTTEQGTACFQERNIFNWTRIAYRRAVDKQGADYRLGGTGPDYDCSGLVLKSYNEVGNLPDFDMNSVRTAEQIYNWARTHTSPAKKYAKQVSAADLKIGDLLFYTNTADNGRFITHVAFWAGDNTLYDAHSPGVPVGFHANTSWWSSRFVTAYRILGVSDVASG
ncbi:C40 family peptidase [Plantactinospora sp. KLBMP9567]|uniref:C40 family peptidase n=1 Tax=Plantactinospora sp. KLBMP9567 TaxID=3085900 RepID=UPI002981BFB5|nr:NlpC/P60 family protein [Plantactinospora sp. KLBMP9567]MDW5323697.1 NlpC/P60 family protein [Plantactinospora sp. KLBMP9567]